MLSRLTLAFLPRSKCLLISWLQSPSAVILEPKKIKICHCFHCFPISCVSCIAGGFFTAEPLEKPFILQQDKSWINWKLTIFIPIRQMKLKGKLLLLCCSVVCCVVQSFSRVQLFAITWTVVFQVFPVLHYHLEFVQTHVHWVSDVIQRSSLLLSPSLPALNLSHHQGLFQWFSSSNHVAKLLGLQRLSFQWIFRVDFL